MNKRSAASVTFLSLLMIFAFLLSSCAPQTEEPGETMAEEVTTEEVAAEEAAAEEEAPAGGGTLYVGVSYDTPNMDHLTSGSTFTAQMLIFDALVSRGPDGAYYPHLAESWDVSDDYLEWTFHLREDVTFHDGTPFNAEAAKWFFDKARDPEGQHVFSGSYSSVTEILTPDDYTLVFQLSNPWPNILFTLSSSFSGMISPTAYETYGEEYGTKYAVGTGPFILEEWIPEDTTTVVRNPDYNWGPEYLENPGVPYLESVVFKYYPESTTRISELMTGGIDILYNVPTTDLANVLADERFEIFTAPAWGGALFYMDMNQTKPPLDDVLVRQAINYALDKETLARLTLGEYGEPAYGYMAEHWHCGMDPEEVAEIGYAYDPQKAIDLLAEAGWTDTDGNGVVDKDGEDLSLLMYIGNDTESQQYGEVMQAEFAEVGIEIELLMLDYGSMVDGFNANENELCFTNYGWPDSDVYNLFFMSNQIPYLNSSHIDDPHMDELLEAANTAPTAEERCELYAQVEQYSIETAVWAPIYWLTAITAVNERVQGILITPFSDSGSYNDITIAE